MARQLPFLFLLLFLALRLPAQNVTFNEEPAITRMMDHFIEVNKAKPFIDGWRVMILSTTDRQQLESVMYAFKQRYPYIQTSWVHNRPYYKLRAGAFATKLEAMRLQYLLREYYPGAYPARDPEVRAEELIGYEE